MKQIQVSKGDKKMVTWTENDPKLKPGNEIRFKNREEFWRIDNVFEKELEKIEINRTWNVGGL